MMKLKARKRLIDQNKTAEYQKKHSRTVAEIFADLPTLPANTRLPCVMSVLTADHYAAHLEEMLAKGCKPRKPDAGDDKA